MRKAKVLFVALIASLFLLNTANANTVNVSPENDLQSSIVSLIDNPNQFIYDADQMTAKILFMVNSYNQVVVVDSGTQNEELASFIKSRLNYKEINCTDYKYYTLYSVKVTFKK